ncbi:MAG: hypothetical protein NC320_04615 [Clostridium sp.]|nr:hypothetical protein [Clostridium sp.]
MKKYVTSIFTVLAFLLLNVTNVSAGSSSKSFILRYIKGATASQVVSSLTIDTQNSREIIIDVTQLTEGAKLSVSSSGLNPKQTIITETGIYHISLSQMTAKISVNMRLIIDESAPSVSVTGSVRVS